MMMLMGVLISLTVGITVIIRSGKLYVSRIDWDHVAKYKRLCGYTGSQVPICYPETLFLRTLFSIITSTKFCLSPIGLIHIEQTITQHHPLEEFEDNHLNSEVSVDEYRQTYRGVEVDIRMELYADQRIWVGVATLLSRVKAGQSSPPRTYALDDRVYPARTEVHVPADCGRQYALLTGDLNPHHLWWWTARPLGFQAPIAHGMWTLSRALAAVRPDTRAEGTTCSVTCSFKRPLYMPGDVSIRFSNPDRNFHLRVEDTSTGVPHLVARIQSFPNDSTWPEEPIRKRKFRKCVLT